MSMTIFSSILNMDHSDIFVDINKYHNQFKATLREADKE
jgi:hypothetical protein